MQNRWSLLWAAGVGSAWLGFAPEASAITAEQRFEKLERHILELERRLEASETENQKLRSKQPTAASTAPEPDIKALNQKVKVLERKLEVADEVAIENAKKTPKLEAGSNGIRFVSPDNEHIVRLRGSVQADYKFFMDDNRTPAGASTGFLADRFELKQARIWLEGTLWKYLDFKIMPDFGNGRTILADAFIDAHYFHFASLNFGKQKTPISLERLQGDSDGTFLERAYPTYLASNRDIGVMLHGEFAKPGYQVEYGGPVDFKNFFSYQLGVFDGAGDNGSIDTDIDDDKEFAGRLWSHPFQHSGIAPLEGLGIGIAGSWELPKRAALVNINSAIGQNRILDYGQLTTGTSSLVADGDHYRIYPQAYWFYGPYGLMGEYVLSSHQLLGSRNGQTGRIQQDNTAWQVQASYVITGEDNTFQSVKPRQAFNPFNGQWGAWQVAARWSELDIDDDTFVYVNPSRSVSKATAWAVGVNWFLTRNARLMADYEQTYFDGGAAGGRDRPTEKVFATRFQLVF
ncbi:porin [Methylocaldum sp. GT1TLB]|jgi:phosphate-selective porin OprO/OprP|uniref:porin n=1 Tax=Methylocaldum sp. GT1TLB TaxID=3438965 RepID=UPI003DA03EDB